MWGNDYLSCCDGNITAHRASPYKPDTQTPWSPDKWVVLGYYPSFFFLIFYKWLWRKWLRLSCEIRTSFYWASQAHGKKATCWYRVTCCSDKLIEGAFRDAWSSNDIVFHCSYTVSRLHAMQPLLSCWDLSIRVQSRQPGLWMAMTGCRFVALLVRPCRAATRVSDF